ncbi:hypothetical protein [Halochromatium roseum]|uniref:hypothetical protein n=1 Tax=Halochromatium roseum TaxID=391920 RepID=UPI001913E5E4|nr:hypothetical protein [Halochromatium roseum]MBK5938930.1 hypothetical protein [Halochromatium roseum]
MDSVEAKILLRNLLKRIKTQDDGSHQLPGVLTDAEVEALQLALGLFDDPVAPSIPIAVKPPVAPVSAPISPIPAFPGQEGSTPAPVETPEELEPPPARPRIDLDLSALTRPSPPKNVRLCLDFGTAMSKATLVQDNDDTNSEDIHVLRLGVPGDQEEVSEVMLISSVYIDANGKLWFGKAAVDRSMVEGGDGSRQRLDNIKRRLSEEGWNEQVGPRLNPTDLAITYGDMVLAYLMFMTWAVNSCLEEIGYPWNLPRRFAMPCLPGEKGRETVHRLGRVVGEAQVLADTFYSTLKNGIALVEFLAAVEELRSKPRDYVYVAEDITEPLGVAGSILSWKTVVDMLILVVDVGAGTSDLSLYRVHFDPTSDKNVALEIKDSSRGLTEAGNHLDRMLIELIIKKSGMTSDDPMWVNVRSALELQIRDLKESLFNDEFIFVSLMNGTEVDIELSEFLELDAVAQFGANLRGAMVDILEAVDPSWINWILAHPSRRLVVALTGGGAELPMVKALAAGSIKVNGQHIPVAQALSFPNWLRKLDENLEADYPRIAVSLGGARRRLIQRGAAARITAGDVTQAPKLGGYYVKGN